MGGLEPVHLKFCFKPFCEFLLCILQVYEETRKVLEQCDLEAGLQLFISQHQTGTDRPGTDSADQVQTVQTRYIKYRLEQWDLEAGLQLFISQHQTGTDRPGTDSADQVQIVQTRYR